MTLFLMFILMQPLSKMKSWQKFKYYQEITHISPAIPHDKNHVTTTKAVLSQLKRMQVLMMWRFWSSFPCVIYNWVHSYLSYTWNTLGKLLESSWSLYLQLVITLNIWKILCPPHWGQNVIPKMTIPLVDTWITAAQSPWSYQQVQVNSFVALCSIPQAV